MIGLLVLLVLATTSGIVSLLLVNRHLDNQVQRIDGVFDGLQNRPDKPTAGPAAHAMNILVMGTDRRSEAQTTGDNATAQEWVPGAQRTDTIMIMHIDGDRDGASVISIPRDSWVNVPGYGFNKINAAFSFAGPSLAVQTVEELTGVRIDHLAVVDWEGFKALIDSVGGVTVTVPQTVDDPHLNHVWTKGPHHLNGEEALQYSRQRYGLPMGDLDRNRRQQAVVRALARASISTVRGANVFDVYDLLDTLTQNMSVDSGWEFGDMRDLALDLRGLKSGDLHFLSAPVAGFGTEGGGQSVVYLDRGDNASLWRAVHDDEIGRWTNLHPLDTLHGPAL
jgi:LCP family protein required for cell wall assembly